MIQDNKQICLVLFGETGHGKSTLGNAILGKEVFKINDTMQSVTKEIYGCQGGDKSKDIFVIDTPGTNDSEGKENEYLKIIATYLKQRKDIKGIVIVLNYSLNTALQNNAEKSFKTIFRIFKSENIYNNIVVAFTHFYGGRRAPNRNEQGELKEKIFKIFQDNFFNMFGKKCPLKSLPFYFLEIESIGDIDSESKMEIDNMIATIFSRNPIDPKIIQIKNDYNIKDEIISFKTLEDISRFEGDFIIKNIKKYKKIVIKYYDSSKSDNILEELVEEKEEKILNLDLIKQRKILKLQKFKEKKVQEQTKKQIEKEEKIKKQNEEKLQKLKEEQKKIEKKRKKLEEERAKKLKEEEERKRIILERRREKQRRREEEEYERRSRRMRICNAIKYQIDNPRYENDSSKVYELNQTWEYGLLPSSNYVSYIDLELLKTEKIDMSDQPFSTITGRINGALSGKVILGWKLINRHSNENGGSWRRNGKINGTSNYNFTFTSCYWRGIHWTLELYGVIIPYDYYDYIDDYDF